MKIQLIQGQFTGKDAITIITKMIDVKIKFQEEKLKLTKRGRLKQFHKGKPKEIRKLRN